MCGIFCMINYDDINECIESLYKIKHRGPDDTKSRTFDVVTHSIECKVFMGFNRLAINELTDDGMQPFVSSIGESIVCNGEIYNHKILEQTFGKMSNSDCGVLLPIFNKLPFHLALRYLDAEFALVYFDGCDTIYTARDRYGVRPLFIGMLNTYQANAQTPNAICISSEMKAIPARFTNVFQLKPTMFMKFRNNILSIHEYYIRLTLESITPNIKHMRDILNTGIKKRLMSDRPIGFLLSGGLDSSIIVYLASKLMKPSDMVCFTVGTEGSPDIVAAKQLTEFLGITNHHILNFNIEEAIECIPEVIKCIESYDITTIRASVPQYLLGRYIKNNTDIRVILSGEGSDEIHGSYKYFEKAEDKTSFRNECSRLLSELCYFDNLRTDRTMAAWGLEVRCPFLDYQYVNYIFTTDPTYYMYSGIEKSLLRSCFKGEFPNVDRPKDAFSDSVSSDKENWRLSIIAKVGDEKKYYQDLFNEYYPNRLDIIPHLWLPRWCGAISDPSATVLSSLPSYLP